MHPKNEASYILIHAIYRFWAILAILIRSVLPACCVWKYITRLRWPACIKNNPKFIRVYFSAENYSSLFFLFIREVTCGSCVATFFMHVMYMKQQVCWNDKQSDNFLGDPRRDDFRCAPSYSSPSGQLGPLYASVNWNHGPPTPGT